MGHDHHGHDHGLIYKALITVVMVTTVFLISFLKPPKFYKKLIDSVFNIGFKWRGADWKIYHVLFLWVSLFVLLLACNY
jgi:hypothetical protein